MGRLFGTDGVRGTFGVDLTTELVRGLGAAASSVLTRPGEPAVAVVGRDTRPSGPDLEAALVDSLVRAGIDVHLVGVIPTPAVAHLVGEYGAAFGVMISASHNPAPDNGIKFFDDSGFKLADDVEDAIESALGSSPPTGIRTGTCVDVGLDARDRYVRHLRSTVAGDVGGLRVVVDCANGAAGSVADAAYRSIGAEPLVINDSTDGERINDHCGATHLDALRAAVVDHGATAGFAHDGDADRCIAVDEHGDVVDGDAILAVLALSLHEQGRLRKDSVVTTVMTNLGFHQAMDAHGIDVAVTAVGDRYVLERMRADGLALGGEQSGHVVLLEHAVTGDGILTALQLIARMAETDHPLSELASVMTRLPQVLVNVAVADRDRATESADLALAVAEVETELGAHGRVLVRPSGTEPVVRVMVEAPTEEMAQAAAARVAAALR